MIESRAKRNVLVDFSSCSKLCSFYHIIFANAENNKAKKSIKTKHTITMSSEHPNTAIVLIGNEIFFKPGGNVISATVTKREDLSTCLDSRAGPSSLDSLHLIMKASSVPTLLDADALSSFVPHLRPSAEVIVHITDNRELLLSYSFHSIYFCT